MRGHGGKNPHILGNGVVHTLGADDLGGAVEPGDIFSGFSRVLDFISALPPHLKLAFVYPLLPQSYKATCMLYLSKILNVILIEVEKSCTCT